MTLPGLRCPTRFLCWFTYFINITLCEYLLPCSFVHAIGGTFQPGATVVVRNGYVHMFDQHMRLGVDKWGKIAAADEPADFQIDTTINMSDQEYQLISVGGSARGGRGGFPRGRGGMRGNFRGGNQAKNNF
eukprot:GHVT01077901.1.p2 GENE.GHVT01077901.1~~GHVT01077901.1.p2  ORF type:complete len:131 (-),score=5.75 GHVT01077901.1:334-726(-)